MAFDWSKQEPVEKVPNLEDQDSFVEKKMTVVPGVDSSNFWGKQEPVEETSGTRGLQKQAIGNLTQIGEHLVPFGIIPKGIALGKSYIEDKPYSESRKEVRNYLDKIEKPAGLMGDILGYGTELGTTGIGTNLARNALGIGLAEKTPSLILNAIENRGLSGSEKLIKALPDIGRSTGEGAAISSIAGGLESEHPNQILPNMYEGAKTGGFFGGVLGAAGKLLGESGTANKFGKSFKMGTEGEKTIGAESNIATNKQSIDTAEQVAKNMMNPLEVSGNLYNAELQRAKNIGKIVEPKIGITQASKDVVQELPLKKAQDYHEMLVSGDLNPVDAKEYQKLIQSTLNSKMRMPVGQEISIEKLKTLNNALKTGIDNTLPTDRLQKINQIYSGARKGLETFINDGVQNPEFQLHSVSDYAPGEVGGKLVEKLRDDVIPNISRVNPSSAGPVQGTFANYLKSAKEQEANLNKIIQQVASEEAYAGTTPVNTGKNIVPYGTSTTPEINSKSLQDVYGKSKIDYKVPQSIQQLEDAGNREAITGATGSYHVGENQAAGKLAKAVVSPLEAGLSVVTGLPYHVANAAGIAISPMRKAANALEAHPVFSSVGKSLNDALNNPTDTAKNAMLMKIMQNPGMRKAMGVDINEENKEKK